MDNVLFENQSLSIAQSSVNVFLIPHHNLATLTDVGDIEMDQMEKYYQLHSLFDSAINGLLLNLKSIPNFSSKSDYSHSQKEWLDKAEKVWLNIQQLSFG